MADFDPFQSGAIALEDDEPDFDPFKSGAVALDEAPVTATPPPEKRPSLTQRLFGAQEQAGFTMETGDMGPVLLRTSPETQAAAKVPSLTLPKTELRQEDSPIRKAGGAAWNTVAGFVEGATSHEGLEGLINPFVGVGQMGIMVPQLMTAVREADKTPANSPERWQAAANLIGALALPVAAHGALKLAGPKRPPALTERLFPEVVERPADAPPTLTERLFPETIERPTGEAIDQSPMAEVIAPEPPPVARLRPGENQGDLLSTQTEDLTLVGEKGTDHVARQAETEAVAQRSEEARLKAESEQGLLADFKESQARGGDELMDAVESGGGLPAKSSPRSEILSGELKNIREEIVSETGKQKYGFDYNKVFKSDAPDLDALTQHLRSKGFDVETPNDTLSLIQDRLRSREPVFGNEAKMTVLEEASLGPGAASAKEPLASYEQRRFGKRLQEDEGIAPEIRKETGNQFYEPVSNVKTLREAEDIVELYGTDTAARLVRDESAPLEPRVRATLAQGLTKKLNQSYQEAKTAGDAPRAQEFLNQSVDTAEYLSELGTKLGQGVQAFAMWQRLTPEGTLLSVRRSVTHAHDRLTKINPKIDPKKLPNLTPELEAKILDLAGKVQEAAEGLPKDRATRALNEQIARIKGFDATDLPIGVYYSHILSGYNTHIVNSLDTFLNVLSEVNGLAVTNPRAAASIYGGMIRGIGEGRLDAMRALTEGRMATDTKWMDAPRLMEVARFGEKGGVPIQETGPVSRVAKKVAESPIAKPLNAYKYVTRLLAASDAIMFRGAKESRAALLAHRMAEAEGLTGDGLIARQREILGSPDLAAFQAQAAREGFTGRDAKVRAAELRDMTRPEELNADAAEFAGISTYNHEPTGLLGYFAKGIATASEKYPGLKLFVPFTRIVANVTNRGLNYTPFGFARARKLAGEEQRLMLTRATLGTAGLGLLGTLQAQGVLQIHGAGPADSVKRKQQQAAGWKPYTIQIGDDYFSYVYTPVGLGLSVVGNMSDADRYKELEQKDAATRAGYAISRIPSTVFSQSFLSGLSRLFNALSSNPAEAVTALKQTLSSTAGALTTPNLVRDIQRLFDPKAYRSETLAQDMVKNTPFAALALKPDLNAFGEPVKLPRQRFVGQLTDDPVWRTVIKLQLRVPVPNKSTEIKQGQQITPEQYYNLLKTTGPQVKNWIGKNEKRLRKLTPEEAQDELSQATAAIRKKALNRIR